MTNYGHKDATFLAAGGEPGIRKLVDCFYDIMSAKQDYSRIYQWHNDVATARDKLARFLCGWMGGPRRYQNKYGAISIPEIHAHLAITTVERDMWIACMEEALALQAFPDSLKHYLIEQFAIPAERVRLGCERNKPLRDQES